MRNTLFLLTVLFWSGFLLTVASNPKETRYYKHEVSISVGYIGVRSNWSDNYENSLKNRYGVIAGNMYDGSIMHTEGNDTHLKIDSYPFSAHYYYHFNHSIAIGGVLSGCSVNCWMGYPQAGKWKGEIQKTGKTDINGVSLFLMPSVKWTWLNNRWCSLYSKAVGGFHFQSLHLDSDSSGGAIPEEDLSEYTKNNIGLSYYITPVGWEIGKQKVRWFMEWGAIGTNKNFQIGITYRFGRY